MLAVKLLKNWLLAAALFFVFLFFVMVGAKVSLAKKGISKSCIVCSKIPAVSFGSGTKKGDVEIYFVDKKGLKNAVKNFGDVLKNKVDFEKFEAKSGQKAALGYINDKKVVVIGIEKDAENEKNNKKIDSTNFQYEKLGAGIVGLLPEGKDVLVALHGEYAEGLKGDKLDDLLVSAYFGFAQRHYSFDKYFTSKDFLEKKSTVKSVLIDAKQNDYNKQLLKEVQAKLEGIYFVRDMANEPANVVYPESFADEVKRVFAGVKNVKVNVMSVAELKKKNMNLLLGVAQGSAKEPKVVVIEYRGNPKSKGMELALIGKGVTFDSGGLSLKPSPHMEGMKCDMTGSATVIGTILALAKEGAKVNAVAVGGMVENMPGSHAQKVGDIVRSMSGKTVEIIDTDAEGRLVLADILYYAQTTYKPKYMIDVATLTGAIMVALGQSRAGIFSNSDELGKKLQEIGEKTGDRNWFMPLDSEHTELIKSNVADLRNLGKVRWAGSATAAAFLQEFIDDNKNWAHVDMAGVDLATGENPFAVADTAFGYGVKMLTEFAKSL